MNKQNSGNNSNDINNPLNGMKVKQWRQ
jgi:hypothetical protein